MNQGMPSGFSFMRAADRRGRALVLQVMSSLLLVTSWLMRDWPIPESAPSWTAQAFGVLVMACQVIGWPVLILSSALYYFASRQLDTRH